HVGTFGVLEEQRRAAHAAEGAHRRVDAAGDVLLGVGEEEFGAGHGGFSLKGDQSNSAANAPARSSTSLADCAANRAWMTAIRSAPWLISWGAVCCVTPPMATIGWVKRRRASPSNARSAAGAPGLVLELKKRPKAM